MLRADWLLAADLCSIPQAAPHTGGLSAQSALLPLPAAASHTQTRTHEHSWVRVASVRTTGRCYLPTSPESAEQGAQTLNNAQVLHYAIPQVTTFALLQEVTGGDVCARAVIMDCLFLLIWTLPIPLVGCTSVKLLSTLLSWNIIKACGT